MRASAIVGNCIFPSSLPGSVSCQLMPPSLEKSTRDTPAAPPNAMPCPECWSAGLFGDSVNIAARLEGIAEPGGVCMSDDAYRQVRGKIEIGCDDLGPQTLKNIVEPMRVWRIQLGSQSAPKAQFGSPASQAPALALPNKPSVAVLPFQNMSGDAEQEYFADGMVEDIITALSRFKSLFVIARNSSFTYKG